MFCFVIFTLFVQTLHMTLLFVYFMIQETFFPTDRTEMTELTGGMKFVILLHEIGQIIQLISPLVLGLFMLFVIKYFSMPSSSVGVPAYDSRTDSDFRSSITDSQMGGDMAVGSNQLYQEKLLASKEPEMALGDEDVNEQVPAMRLSIQEEDLEDREGTHVVGKFEHAFPENAGIQ